MEAGITRQTSPCEIERISPKRPAHHAFIDKPSKGHNSHRGKKRKLAADTVTVPEAQEEVDTTPTSEANGASGCVQPHASDEEAGEASVIPPGLLSKLSLIGSAEVLKDLKHTLFRLRSHPSEGSLIPAHRTDTICTSDSHNTLRSLQTAQVFLMLRNELEVTEIGEQMYKFRKRLALSRFFDLYDVAQKNPLSFLEEDAETIQESSRNMTSNAPRLDSRVLNRIVDLMFPTTAHTSETGHRWRRGSTGVRENAEGSGCQKNSRLEEVREALVCNDKAFWGGSFTSVAKKPI